MITNESCPDKILNVETIRPEIGQEIGHFVQTLDKIDWILSCVRLLS